MQRKPPTLGYASPASRGRYRPEPVNPLTAVAFAVSTLSLVTTGVPDPGGMRRRLQVVVGVWGGLVGLTLAVVALIRLVQAGRATSSHAPVAALALTLGLIAIWFGLRLYWR